MGLPDPLKILPVKICFVTLNHTIQMLAMRNLM